MYGRHRRVEDVRCLKRRWARSPRDRGRSRRRAGRAERRGRGLDSEALRLWAGSILSEARVACGVYIVDGADREVGRFSLEDLGEGEFESALRAARFGGGSGTVVSQGHARRQGGRSLRRGGVRSGSRPRVGPTSVASSSPSPIPTATSRRWPASSRPSSKPLSVSPRGGMQFGGGYSASLVSGGRIVETTARDLEVGSDLGADVGPRWVERKTASGTWVSYLVPLARPGEALALGFRLLTLSERAVFLMAVVVANVIVALIIVLAVGAVRATRFLVRRARGGPRARFRWSFATKLGPGVPADCGGAHPDPRHGLERFRSRQVARGDGGQGGGEPGPGEAGPGAAGRR